MQTVIIESKSGRVTIPCTSPAPGLAVHKYFGGLKDDGSPNLGRGYNVTHILSGLKINPDGGFEFRKHAVRYAKMFAEHYPASADKDTLLEAVNNRGTKPAPIELYWQSQR